MVLLANDFGFLVLFNGRTSSQLELSETAAELGAADARAATALAESEGFHTGTVIFSIRKTAGA